MTEERILVSTSPTEVVEIGHIEGIQEKVLKGFSEKGVEHLKGEVRLEEDSLRNVLQKGQVVAWREHDLQMTAIGIRATIPGEEAPRLLPVRQDLWTVLLSGVKRADQEFWNRQITPLFH